MKRDYSQFFAILKKNDLEYKEVILEFTSGHTDSLRSLSDAEYSELMRRVAMFNTVPAGDKQRKKMISLAKAMHWGKTTAEILSALNGWCLKQKFQKPLMQLDLQQLGVLLTIFETKVYADYLKGLNK